MKYIILTFSLFLLLPSLSGQQRSTTVTSHKQVVIFTNPKEGSNSFIQWAVFPEKNKAIRKVTMLVTLAYPKDRAIAHWDYLDHIKILRSGGENSKSLNYEIGRLLTPYGSNFKEDWSYTWKVDVTDFESFLRDSVEIEYIHTGYESPDLGWDLTIDFKIDFGPSIAKFISIEKLWDGQFQYGNPDNDIENHLCPVKIKRAKVSNFGRIRIQHTGHGMDEPNGCSEFCSRWREVIVDEQVIDKRDMWKDCGDNPLYPQGGTWIYDRAYWCPGDLQEPDIFNIPLNREEHTLDIRMKPFIANNKEQPKENVTAYFFQFAEPNHQNDVSVEEIIAPNHVANFNRYNPRAFEPIIKIRNLGKKDLKLLKIVYGTEGYKSKTYNWKGNLSFYETDTIYLPGIIDAKPGENTFFVKLEKPNGKKDEWENDNELKSVFEDIPVLPTDLVLNLLTNNKPEDNSLYIINSKKDTVFQRLPENLSIATEYFDTLLLNEGNYHLVLDDKKGDGLEFWFEVASGFGQLRLKDTKDNLIKLFESDCGNGQFYAFRCKKDVYVDSTINHLAVNIFPRMANDSLTIYATSSKESTLKIRITKDGKYVEQHEYTGIKESSTGLNIRHLEKGRYVMEIYIDGEHKMNRRFNKIK